MKCFLTYHGLDLRGNAKAYRTEVQRATDKELRADGNIYAGAIPGFFIIELLAQLAHQLAP
jgi:predicted hotdog family 3-hydroxylacyl-ACP dehydratase